MKRTLAVVASLAMALMSIFAVAAPASAQYVPDGPVAVSADGAASFTGLTPGEMFTAEVTLADGSKVQVTGTADAAGKLTLFIPAGASFIQGVNFALPLTAVAAPAPAAPAVAAPAVAAPAVAAPVSVTLAQSPSLQGVAAAPAGTARPALALTGGETLTPVLIGTALIAVGGMALVSSKRRESVVS